jgi:hypothetical protein
LFRRNRFGDRIHVSQGIGFRNQGFVRIHRREEQDGRGPGPLAVLDSRGDGDSIRIGQLSGKDDQIEVVQEKMGEGFAGGNRRGNGEISIGEDVDEGLESLGIRFHQ